MIISKRTKKILAIFLAINLLGDAFFPTAAMALTSGPSQPEMQSFTPVSTSDMVDVGSGDFNYNIPLLDVEGYPVNLSYNAGISNDQEATWVGLGWNINPGVINRNMRSLPDDFNGDVIKKEMNMRANQTIGVSYSNNIELFGKGKTLGGNLSLSAGVKYNNYMGFSTDLGANFSLRMHSANASGWDAGLGLNSSSGNGLGISPNVSYSKYVEKKDTDGHLISQTNSKHGFHLQLNSGQGLQSINYTFSQNKQTYEQQKNEWTDKMETVKTGETNKGSKWSYSFANPTYTPYIGNEMCNLNISFDLSFGAEFIGANPKSTLSAYYSTQYLKRRDGQSQTLKGYGYMNAQNMVNPNEENVLLDMNREKDGSFTKHTPNLHLTNFTYDVFAVKGQGIGGTYRPHRSDIGIVHDARTYNRTESIDAGLGFDFGVGNAAKWGINSYGLGQTNSVAGAWTTQGGGSEVGLQFKSSGTDPYYEPYYFALAGEKVAESDISFYNNVIMGSKPMRINLERRFVKNLYATNNYDIEGVGTVPIPSANTRAKRAKRNEVFSEMNAGMASVVGQQTSIVSYPQNDFEMFSDPGSTTGIESTSRTLKNGYAVNHHISEISVVREDGARYIYGLPAYNLTQEETSFAVNTLDGSGNNIINHTNGTVPYSPGQDNSGANNKQIDHFYSKTTTPPYAHSYLLTSVLSVDYVDATSNGPSADDLGNYTKFNYSQCKSETGSKHYKWRIPFDENAASPNEGMLSKKGVRGDDKANYTYGEKEIWNLHSIETKNYVAIFFTSKREDGYGVTDKNGTRSGEFALRKLDKIELYSKKELETAHTMSVTPVPLKTVHFEYDYSLCGSVSNPLINNSQDPDPSGPAGADINTEFGKLTLKKVYFTYQGSNKGKLSPYKFTYEHDYDYESRSYDCWGNYKPNTALGTAYNYTSTSATTTTEDPYAVQSQANADAYAAAWALSEIELPSGGKITVDYEADDYAFVQNKRAMQMFKMHGFYDASQLSGGTDLTAVSGTNLFTPNTGFTDPVSKLFMVVEIDAATAAGITVGGTIGSTQVKQAFLHNENGLFQKVRNNAANGNSPSPEQMPIVYFRALVNINRANAIGYDGNPKYEYISGYAQLDFDESADDAFVGYKTYGGRHFVYFKLKGVDLDDGVAGVTTNADINPISMAGLNFVKMYFPEIAYNNSQTISDGISFDDFIQSIVSAFKPIVDVFRGGITKSMWKTGCSAEFIPQKSFVRLYSPLNKKRGGGYRVKQLKLNDNWQALADDGNYVDSEYGQSYKYVTRDRYGKEISSGVATYEPLIGSDQNPWHQPVFYSEKNILAPDADYYQEEPYGESFFPSASVGYSRVEVRSISHDVNVSGQHVGKHGTGKVVHEFYTAKDFPVKLNRTQMSKKVFHPTRFFPNPLKVLSQDFLAASQGFVIELNDMHGKPKAQYVYAQGEEDPTKYISAVQYKYRHNGDRVDNEVLVIKNNGEIESGQVGLEYDLTVDMNEHRKETRNVEGQANADNFVVGIFLTIPTFFPKFQQENTAFKSASVTKVVNHFGLLEETTAFDLGSSVTTKNKLWDAETGAVVLTETRNNFDDNIYSFNYPAHWAYNRMGGAYQNIGFARSLSGGTYIDSYAPYFVEGDELYVTGASASKVWVTSTSPFRIMDKDGTIISNSSVTYFKVIRSGRRNVNAASVGQLVSLKNPVVWDPGAGKFVLNVSSASEIINASAVEYGEKWKTFCQCGTEPSDAYNPYIKGIKGNWRPLKSLAFLSSRKHTKENENTNIRKDGTYTTYVPYWTTPAGLAIEWTKSSDNGWQFASEVSLYSPYGFELENKDALGRYSAAVYGYNHTYPVQVTSNSRYSQTAFDGFEDYDFTTCSDDHLGLKKAIEDAGSNASVKQTSSTYQKYSHTGRRSVKVNAGKSVELTKPLDPCPTGGGDIGGGGGGGIGGGVRGRIGRPF